MTDETNTGAAKVVSAASDEAATNEPDINKSKPGYKRPPKQTQFKPGASGNPSGRPKGSANLRTEISKLLSETVSIRENGKRKRVTRQEAMLLSLYDKAVRGDVRAINTFANMTMKLNPAATPEREAVLKLSKSDEEIVADFLRRNQPTTPKP